MEQEQRAWFVQQIKENEWSMFNLSMSILCNEDDAADAAQEAICTAYRKLDALRDHTKFKAWILRILANECYRILRDKRRYMQVETLPETEVFDVYQDGPSALWQAVSRLNEDMRSVIVLFYYEDFNIKEIASILKISEANAKTRLSRARKRLKAMLEEQV